MPLDTGFDWRMPGTAWEIKHYDPDSGSVLVPWYGSGSTPEGISYSQEGMLPSVTFRQHELGWLEIIAVDGSDDFPIIGIFVPKAVEEADPDILTKASMHYYSVWASAN